MNIVHGLIRVLIIGAALVVPATAAAHSTVSPSQSIVSKYENFQLSVPTEKNVPTVGVRLIIPSGLERVMPLVKPGWKISTEKDQAGNVTEIIWIGGSIPEGQKDVFQFSGRTPATSTTLVWKAYQTYQGGEIVVWDRDPHAEPEGEESVENPWSETAVTIDATPTKPIEGRNTLPLTLSVAALAISVFALTSNRKKNA